MLRSSQDEIKTALERYLAGSFLHECGGALDPFTQKQVANFKGVAKIHKKNSKWILWSNMSQL